MPWSQLTSQPLVCDLLRRSLACGRMHHGYIFVGDSSETESVALAFAQALNCEKNDGDFCGVCESCSSITRQSHPDIHAVRPESRSRRIVISQVRQLEKSIYLKASRARMKLAILHGADRLVPEAQDAFLKTLEEPPPKTMFLLLTDEPQQLRDTILSRCLRIPFRPGSPKEKAGNKQKIEEWLAEFSKPVPASEATLFRAYGLAGNVLGLLNEVRAEKLKEVEQMLDDPALENLDSSQRKRMEEQMDAQAQADYLHERTALLRFMLEWYHAHRHGSRAHIVSEILETLSRRLSRNVNEPLAWEIALLDLADLHVA